MKTDDAFHGITTLITASMPEGHSQGTGFFYQQLAPAENPGEPSWRAIEKTWLVTNRHVVFPRIDGGEKVPETVSLYLRRFEGPRLIWDPVTLSKDDLLSRARVHRDPKVDVCVIEILDLLTEKMKGGGKFAQWYAVHAEQLPGKNNINVEVSDDAVVIGYPRGFYDHVNLFPIVKSGIIATRWGANFKGLPYFLIDAKLFPGSSGSIVVSRPRDLVVVDGKLLLSKEKQFAFLGIFSGEPSRQELPVELEDMTIVRKSSFNLGIVWYGHLVDQIIAEGVSHASPPANSALQADRPAAGG